jgi:hypothetical protein
MIGENTRNQMIMSEADNQRTMIRQLKRVRNAITMSSSSGNATLAEQQTQTNALNNIIAAIGDSKDFEIKLISDSGNGDLIVKEIKTYDASSGTFTTTYETASGTPYVPIGPLVYLDASALLDLILTTLDSILAQLDVDLSTRASEVTAALINANVVLGNITLDSLVTAVDAEDFASQTTLAALLTELQLKADLTETQPVSVLQSDLIKLEQEANDLVKTFSYLDAGLPDERVSTIVYSSIVLALTVTKTFVYAGSSPNFRVSTITLS